MKAVALIKNKDGRVVGVSCESNGKKYDFYAKGGIILATGGFGANAAMVKKYNPSLDERFKTTDAPGTTVKHFTWLRKPALNWSTCSTSRPIRFVTRFRRDRADCRRKI